MTELEEEITETLTCRVRLLSLAQLQRTWWSDAPEAAPRALERLCATGWLRRRVAELKPELPLEAPLLRWSPGEGEPDFGGLAYRARIRFTGRSAPEPVFLGTQKAADAFGGHVPDLKAQSLTHDIHVAALYLALRKRAPAEAALWITEDELAPDREGEVLPDAALRARDGTLLRVIEFVGSSYTAERLSGIHFDCLIRHLPYELW
jgi:hypothetical protein